MQATGVYSPLYMRLDKTDWILARAERIKGGCAILNAEKCVHSSTSVLGSDFF